jgi:hypothetical protein
MDLGTSTMDEEAARWSTERRELESRLLEAAEALLEHQGASFALVPFPGRLPARCVAIGELARIREMVKPAIVEA